MALPQLRPTFPPRWQQPRQRGGWGALGNMGGASPGWSRRREALHRRAVGEAWSLPRCTAGPLPRVGEGRAAHCRAAAWGHALGRAFRRRLGMERVVKALPGSATQVWGSLAYDPLGLPHTRLQEPLLEGGTSTSLQHPLTRPRRLRPSRPCWKRKPCACRQHCAVPPRAACSGRTYCWTQVAWRTQGTAQWGTAYTLRAALGGGVSA